MGRAHGRSLWYRYVGFSRISSLALKLLTNLDSAGNGTTSYAENIGAIAITQVGSRVVVQVAACFMIIIGLCAKLSAIFASLPTSIAGGIYCIVFGLIVAIGLSNLQYIDLNSERNLFIIGFANSLLLARVATCRITTLLVTQMEGKSLTPW